MMQAFQTPSVHMRATLLMTVQAPTEDIQRIVAAVLAITPLAMGAYDSNAFQSGPGTEHYRPLAGAAAGPEPDVRHRPGIVEVSFELPDDERVLDAVVEAVFQTHSYQEPVIRLLSILSSRSKGRDDSGNPNRWWNRTGDWKQGAAT